MGASSAQDCTSLPGLACLSATLPALAVRGAVKQRVSLCRQAVIAARARQGEGKTDGYHPRLSSQPRHPSCDSDPHFYPHPRPHSHDHRRSSRCLPAALLEMTSTDEANTTPSRNDGPLDVTEADEGQLTMSAHPLNCYVAERSAAVTGDDSCGGCDGGEDSTLRKPKSQRKQTGMQVRKSRSDIPKELCCNDVTIGTARNMKNTGGRLSRAKMNGRNCYDAADAIGEVNALPPIERCPLPRTLSEEIFIRPAAYGHRHMVTRDTSLCYGDKRPTLSENYDTYKTDAIFSTSVREKLRLSLERIKQLQKDLAGDVKLRSKRVSELSSQDPLTSNNGSRLLTPGCSRSSSIGRGYGNLYAPLPDIKPQDRRPELASASQINNGPESDVKVREISSMLEETLTRRKKRRVEFRSENSDDVSGGTTTQTRKQSQNIGNQGDERDESLSGDKKGEVKVNGVTLKSILKKRRCGVRAPPGGITDRVTMAESCDASSATSRTSVPSLPDVASRPSLTLVATVPRRPYGIYKSRSTSREYMVPTRTSEISFSCSKEFAEIMENIECEEDLGELSTGDTNDCTTSL